MRSGRAGAEFGGGHAELFAEAFGEIFWRAEAHVVCHVGDIHFGVVLKQAGGFLHPDGLDKFVGRLPGHTFDFMEQTGASQRHFAREEGDVEIFVGQMLFDDLAGAFDKFAVDVVRGDGRGREFGRASEFFLQPPSSVDQVTAACDEQLHIERFGDVVVCSEAQAVEFGFDGCLCREQDDGDMRRGEIVFDSQAHLVA